MRVALSVNDAYRPLSIDAPIAGGSDVNLESVLGGGPDPDLEAAYFCEFTQSEIAATVGISQTGVSRSLARSLRRLRGATDTPRVRPGAGSH